MWIDRTKIALEKKSILYGGPKGPTQTKKENANKKEHITKQKMKTQIKKNTSPKKNRKSK